ncbi:HAD-like domain-containing protein [Chytridium lagenaria]|nr:HAD-like domain-containing protein [Chytridium lagenaria]
MDRPVISHVLFDMDGLLLDTERIYTQVTQTILDPYGKTFTWELKSQMMGLKETDAAAIFVREAQIPMTAEEYLLERNRLHEELMPTCRHFFLWKPFNLKAKNNQNLFKLFDGHITCGDDHRIKAGKPAPDIFLTAAEKLGFDMASGTEKCLVFEDAQRVYGLD